MSNLQLSEEGRSGTAMEDLNVILFGKTGSGKSSLGNTLLGDDIFDVTSGWNSGTAVSSWKETKLDGVSLKVTDVPGLFDTGNKEQFILEETAKSVTLVAPGPHAILFVISANRRFTQEEYDAYLKAKELFTPRICGFVIVVLTSVDSLKTAGDCRAERLKNAVQNAPPLLENLLADVNNRYIGVENEASAENKRQQRKDIIKMIQELHAKNNGQHYALPKEINTLLQKVVEKRAIKDGCNKEVATRAVKEEIVANKQPELVREVKNEAKKNGWGCTIL